ncbi:MAG: dihydroneopterin aldolase [Acidobacteria bacterium]|nr:dihydroneopterin aldolase [Acidobacteriota bacterium]
MVDTILIDGIQIRPRIGTTAGERASRPRCSVDVEIECDLSAPARSDRLTDTIDYYGIYQDVKRAAGEREYCLLERFAGVIADTVLERPSVHAASVTVRKLGRRGLDAFGVTLRRKRGR